MAYDKRGTSMSEYVFTVKGYLNLVQIIWWMNNQFLGDVWKLETNWLKWKEEDPNFLLDY